MAALFAVAAGPRSAEAALVDIFLISSHTTPSNPANAPFTLETSSVYRLGDLNWNMVARSVTAVDDFTFNVGGALTYNSFDTSNQFAPDEGEPGQGTAGLFNSEAGVWDDVGIAGSGGLDKNVNISRNASVTFNPVAGGFTDLILGESANLTPFKLSLCGDVTCSSSELLFSGWNGSVRDFLLGTSEFALGDTGIASEMDQTFLFRFSNPVLDFVRLTEFSHRPIYIDSRVAVDFLGFGSIVEDDEPNQVPAVPLPAGLPLLAAALGLLGWSGRRRKA